MVCVRRTDVTHVFLCKSKMQNARQELKQLVKKMQRMLREEIMMIKLGGCHTSVSLSTDKLVGNPRNVKRPKKAATR